MAFSWKWKRKNTGEPLTRIQVPFLLSTDDLATILSCWAAYRWQSCRWTDGVLEDFPSFPSEPFPASRIEAECRELLRFRGDSIFESYWSDDLSEADTKMILDWANWSIRAAWPDRVKDDRE